ncbi:SDR family oxidoreductase [Gynurincola endophyticus]|uniref:SDR family oxidoreductase n=1 Tax=Gynurincola endophyticus TaxID=2479004 RepID=UPI000F8F0063|nr:SDR family oxidoreductase [Gynurincola endophyticus]
MKTVIKDKHALIGGSTQGIGFAIAKQLAEQGVRCTLVARNEDRLKKAVSELQPVAKGQHQYIVADYSDYKNLSEKINHFVIQDPIHILINNTGGPPAGLIVDATTDAFLEAFQQHLICNQLMAQAVIPGMKAAGWGRIVNIISTSVKIPLHNLGVSNTVRGAVASWSKTLSNELGQYNITVNNVLPGFTETQRLESIIDGTMKKANQSYETVTAQMTKDVPMKRFGTAEEIAAVAVFLAGDAASYVTGVSIPVDGGRTGSI